MKRRILLIVIAMILIGGAYYLGKTVIHWGHIMQVDPSSPK